MHMSMPSNLGSSNSPSFGLVRIYFATAVVAFLTWCFLLALYASRIQGFHFQKLLLALTHVAVLGWVSMAIFGALFQLVPVVFETRLYSERLAWLQFWLHVPGLAGLALGFWRYQFGALFLISAAFLLLSLLLFVGNIAATMLRSKARSLTSLFVASGLFHLAVTAALGFALAVNLGFPYIVERDHLDFLKIHAHLGLGGWVLMVIMGVGLKLIPMFNLSHGFSEAPARAAFALVNGGLVGLALAWWLFPSDAAILIFAGVLAAGVLLFLVQLILIFRSRLRRRPDLGMKYSIGAFVYLFASVLIGMGLAARSQSESSDMEAAVLTYGLIILLGFFSSLIVGQMYKIVPFLVWFHRFSSKVGREPVPMLKDLVNEKLGRVQLWMMNATLLLVWIGTYWESSSLRLAGFVGLSICGVMFAYNLVHIYRFGVPRGHTR
jgi:cbb3-type cytochrome oxidase subunit 1